eukprot:7536240-Ditylum_brightwellii.AAC.1
MSTFGAEFTALKAGVEEAVMLRYHLRSMGIEVSSPTPIFVDNMSMVINATNPGSTLNKKTVALSYHFVREHVANGVVEVREIASEDNFANPFTKAMTSMDSTMSAWSTDELLRATLQWDTHIEGRTTT